MLIFAKVEDKLAMAKEIEVHVRPHASCSELLTQEKFDEDLNYEPYKKIGIKTLKPFVIKKK